MPRTEQDWKDEFDSRIAAAAKIMRANLGTVEILVDAQGRLYGSKTKLRQQRGANKRKVKGRSQTDHAPRIYKSTISEDFNDAP